MSAPERLTLRVHPGRFCICRLAADAPVPEWATKGEFLSITRSAEELSVVCREAPVPSQVHADRGWRLFGVQGPLELTMVGIMAGLTKALAEAHVSLFAISTYDTDYLLVRERDLERAIASLTSAGYWITSAAEDSAPGA